MSLLAQLSTDDSIQQETDNLGGGGQILDSGIYPSTIQTAFINKSEGGALGLVVTFKTETGKELKQTFWMTSGTAKGCRNYYEDKSGEKKYLPGFISANSLALLTTGKEISSLDTETKVVKLWNRDTKSEAPTKVEMVMDLLNKDIILGVIRQTVDKTAKAADGTYAPTGETRDENEVDKFFRAKDGKTTTEIRSQVEEATFVHQWKEKFTGTVKNKVKGASTGAVAGAPKAASAAAKKPAVDLFA